MSEAQATGPNCVVDFDGPLYAPDDGKLEITAINLSFGNIMALALHGTLAVGLAVCVWAIIFAPVLLFIGICIGIINP